MKNITISENGIYLQFAVTEQNRLWLYNFSETEKKECEEFKGCPNLYSVVEVQPTGGNRLTAKRIGLNCSDLPVYKSHIDTRNEYGRIVTFTLTTSKLEIRQSYQFYDGVKTVSAYSEVENISEENVGIEYLSSFCYGGFFDCDIAEKIDSTELYIPHNSWCEELDWRKQTLREAGFNSKKLHNSTNRVKISSRGCWSTKEHLPMGMLCDQKSGLTYLWQIESSNSWCFELGDLFGRAYLRLSGPDAEEHDAYKKLKSGESFKSVPVAVTVTSEGFDGAVGEMTKYRRKIVDKERLDNALPVVFNDYMDCLWANPSVEAELPLIDKAAELGAEIFCMDAGWYSVGDWWPLVGEWEICEERFYGGIDQIFKKIKEKGLRAGIWLEPEVMGINCPLVPEFEDCFFKYRGENIVSNGRYQLDFRKEKVINHLNRVVDNLINRLGVSYFKFDYNIDPLYGTEDDADSCGEGLSLHGEAYLKWIDSLYERYPDLIIENCASGAMRMDYGTLKHFALQSVSDSAHFNEFAHMSVMAPTALLPEQAGIWVVAGNGYTKNQNAVAAVNGMLNRFYMGGRIDLLDEEDFSQLREAVRIYKEIRKDICGSLPIFPLGICNSESDLMVGGRITQDGSAVYITVARLKGDEEDVTLNLPALSDAKFEAKILFPNNSGEISLDGSVLNVKLKKESAMLIKLSRR